MKIQEEEEELLSSKYYQSQMDGWVGHVVNKVQVRKTYKILS
jgi:hypothetical protein